MGSAVSCVEDLPENLRRPCVVRVGRIKVHRLGARSVQPGPPGGPTIGSDEDRAPLANGRSVKAVREVDTPQPVVVVIGAPGPELLRPRLAAVVGMSDPLGLAGHPPVLGVCERRTALDPHLAGQRL